MEPIPDIAICVTVVCLLGGILSCWLGIRMLRGKSLGYIAGNASDYHDDPESPDQKALGGTFGAITLAVGLLLFACIPLCFLYG